MRTSCRRHRCRSVSSRSLGWSPYAGNDSLSTRGGAWSLGKRPDVLHVQLHASIDARVRYLLSRVEEIPPDARPEERALRDICKSIDAARGEYVKRMFGVDWLDARSYDIAIDTGRLGVERSVDLIESAAKAMAAGQRP